MAFLVKPDVPKNCKCYIEVLCFPCNVTVPNLKRIAVQLTKLCRCFQTLYESYRMFQLYRF